MAQKYEEISPTDTDAQEAAQQETERARRLQRDQDVADFKWLMGNKQGRRFMWRLLGVTGVFRTPFVQGGGGLTEFNCGQQNVGQLMLAEIHEHCPERYHEMTKEHHEHARRKRGPD